MEVDVSAVSPSVSFDELAPPTPAGDRNKEGRVSAASEEGQEECLHSGRRTICYTLKTVSSPMSQEERLQDQQLLLQQEGQEERGSPALQQQTDWPATTITAKETVSASVSYLKDNGDNGAEESQLGNQTLRKPLLQSLEGALLSPSATLPLPVGSKPSLSALPTRGVCSCSSTGGLETPHELSPPEHFRGTFVESCPPEAEEADENAWGERARQEERRSRIASRRRTGPQQLSPEQIEEMSVLFAQKCT